ncbi:MAG: proline--tRNA ligase [Candidatus Woesearchaeota archaeon]|nr:proline--tRNA ligase [Candidatus Woesearchaeota archaeon]
MDKNTKGITVKKIEDMSEWYGQVVTKAALADYSPIRGCMIIRPRGYALWTAIQTFFDKHIKANGVENAYFPMFIPESFFKKEAEHAEGFSPEVAWVEQKSDVEERLALRPTSETIMYDSYSRWIRSWRDLPLKINQWCNIIRWEVKDTKIFLRSREFLWQEGHCVYESEKECDKDTRHYLELYRKVAEELLAVPVLVGTKTKNDTFPGAVRSYAIEAFMPDGKALQMGTSHMLGQGFAKSFDIKYLGRDGGWERPWQNSWGISTRMIGSVVLQHGDDKGLVLPPRMVDKKIAIVPIQVKDADVNKKVLAQAEEIAATLKKYNPILDDRDEYSMGWKFNEHELHGVPLRIEIGPKDLEKGHVVLARRDTGEKAFVPFAEVHDEVRSLLDVIQDDMFNRAKQHMTTNTVHVKSWEDFIQADKDKKLIFAAHCSENDCEEAIKEETEGVTARCVPFKDAKTTDNCVKCGKAAAYNVYFARAY